jgi:hypothetical protein
MLNVNLMLPIVRRNNQPWKQFRYLYVVAIIATNFSPTMKHKKYLLISILLLVTSSLLSQQIADTNFNPVIVKSEYGIGKGPVVAVDEGHNNFHTADGRYLPFAKLLRTDGYVVNSYIGEFKGSQLKNLRILVIANALNKLNIQNWYLPTPSAFSKEEIETVRRWVKTGGSLFLIADHMPFGGAAADLASAFGFIFSNGFAADTSKPGNAFFYRKDNTLLPCSITDGRNATETVNKVVTFTGQAFRTPSGATQILRFDERYLLMESDTAWVFDSKTRYTPIKEWSQGACVKYGSGRVVMFGEAAMFSAQLAGANKVKIGINSTYAEENYKLLLNIIHWLDGRTN